MQSLMILENLLIKNIFILIQKVISLNHEK